MLHQKRFVHGRGPNDPRSAAPRARRQRCASAQARVFVTDPDGEVVADHWLIAGGTAGNCRVDDERVQDVAPKTGSWKVHFQGTGTVTGRVVFTTAD